MAEIPDDAEVWVQLEKLQCTAVNEFDAISKSAWKRLQGDRETLNTTLHSGRLMLVTREEWEAATACHAHR